MGAWAELRARLDSGEISPEEYARQREALFAGPGTVESLVATSPDGVELDDLLGLPGGASAAPAKAAGDRAGLQQTPPVSARVPRVPDVRRARGQAVEATAAAQASRRDTHRFDEAGAAREAVAREMGEDRQAPLVRTIPEALALALRPQGVGAPVEDPRRLVAEIGRLETTRETVAAALAAADKAGDAEAAQRLAAQVQALDERLGLARTYEGAVEGMSDEDIERYLARLRSDQGAAPHRATAEGFVPTEGPTMQGLRLLGSGLAAPVVTGIAKAQAAAQRAGEALDDVPAWAWPGAPALGAQLRAVGAPEVARAPVAAAAANPLAQFVVESLYQVERGAESTMARALAAEGGVDPESALGRTARVVDFAVDVLIPVEELVAGPAGTAATAATRAKKAAGLVPEGGRAAAAALGARSALGGDVLLVDLGELARSTMADTWSAGRQVSVPPGVQVAARRVAAMDAEADLDDLLAAANQGDEAARRTVGDVVARAVEIEARATVGDSHLVAVGSTLAREGLIDSPRMATPGELQRAQRQAQGRLAAAGLPHDRASVSAALDQGKVRLTPAQVEAAGVLSPNVGAKYASEAMDPAVWSRVVDDVLVGRISESASTRYAWRSGGVAAGIARTADAAGGAAAVSTLGRAVTDGLGEFAAWLRSLGVQRHPAARRVLEFAQRRVESSGADVLRDVRRAVWDQRAVGRPVAVEKVLDDMLGDGFRGVSAAREEALGAWLGMGRRVPDPTDAGQVARWADVKRTLGIEDDAKATEALWSDLHEVDGVANELWRAIAPLAQQARPSGGGLDLYRAWTVGGVAGARKHMLDQGLVAERLVTDDREALFRLVTSATVNSHMAEIADELVAAGIAIPASAPTLAEAVRALIRGADVDNPVLRLQAEAFMARSGITEGMGGVAPLPGTKVAVGSLVAKDLGDAAARSHLDLAALFRAPGDPGASAIDRAVGRAGPAINRLIATGKGAMLVGLGPLINPAFYVSNFLTMPFMMMNTLGLRGTVSAMATWARPATRRVNAAMVARLTADVTPFDLRRVLPRLDAEVMVDDLGRTHTVDDLVDLATTHGIDVSLVRAESTRALIDDLAALDARGWARAKALPGDMQQTLFAVSQAQELTFRVGVFTDAIGRGADPTEAARLAREAGFDYSKMSEFERFTVRKLVLFYSFTRANIDRTLYALRTDPTRLTRQARLLSQHRDAIWQQDQEEAVGLYDDATSRLVLGALEARTPEGVSSWRYDRWLFATSPLPVADALAYPHAIASMLAGFTGPGRARALTGQTVQEASGGLAERAGAVPAALVTAATGRTTSDKEVVADYANKLPLSLVQLLHGASLLPGLSALEPVPVEDPAAVGGVAYVPGSPAALALWQTLDRTGFGRPFRSLDNAARFALEPELATLPPALGLNRVGVERAERSLRRRAGEQERIALDIAARESGRLPDYHPDR